MLQVRRSAFGKRQRRLFFVALMVGTQMLSRASYGESLFIKKFFYTQHVFNVFVTIHALSGAALNRLELRELGFPEPQDIRRQTTQLGNFSDPEIEFVRDDHVGGLD